ncbi:transferase [Coniochaeta sp. 2T2.1]|nr:transferase [Coniochaeta sp. 2T2.1]
MSKVFEYQLRPLGWENDPEEERFKLSTLDYLTALTYNSYALFFKLDAADKGKVVDVLKRGLERTLSQVRHLAGTIERDPDGHHSFVKRKDSSVKFVVQHLDDFPSFAEIQSAHFVGTSLGDINLLSNSPMTYGEKPEADPDASPVVASYKANFIPGGLILNMHSHHYANDVAGWASVTRQLADNCRAIIDSTPFPPWDPACLDRSRFASPPIPVSAQVSAPPQAARHPDHKPSSCVIFHLPKSKAVVLKQAASPTDGNSWISTYDAFVALLWRVVTRLRVPLHNPDPTSTPIWAEGINMSKRLSPPLPTRMQGNQFLAVLSAMSPVPAFTVEEITSPDVPLSRLASYVRSMTSTGTSTYLDTVLQAVAPVGNKKDLSVRINSFPPLTFGVTDWRDADVCATAEFGFGRPVAFRHLFSDTVSEGLVIVYPPKQGGEDEGVEVQFAVEKELVGKLVEDEELGRWFEYRGVDVEGREGV